MENDNNVGSDILVKWEKYLTPVPEALKKKVAKLLERRDKWGMSEEWRLWAVHLEICLGCCDVTRNWKYNNLTPQERADKCCEVGKPLFLDAVSKGVGTKPER